PATVDGWLAATGLSSDTSVHVDGNEQSLRDALIVSYDICRVTPNLLSFVAESCRDKAAAKTLMAPKLHKWLASRNALHILPPFAPIPRNGRRCWCGLRRATTRSHRAR